MVFLSDGYLKVPAKEEAEQIGVAKGMQAQRFFSLASQLPMELQMVLCNRVFGLEGSIIKQIHSEKGFKKFVKGF